jgi:hypothetical protein
MTKAELINKLNELAKLNEDPEAAHCDADDELLKYINDPEITKAFNAVPKWYA